MIKKILIGFIYIAIYLNLILALIISVILWVVTSIVSYRKKEWLRKVILIVAVTLFFLSYFQEYLAIRNVTRMSLAEYTLTDYLIELKNYYQLLWIPVIWLYLYKLGPIKEYFIEKKIGFKKLTLINKFQTARRTKFN